MAPDPGVMDAMRQSFQTQQGLGNTANLTGQQMQQRDAALQNSQQAVDPRFLQNTQYNQMTPQQQLQMRNRGWDNSQSILGPQGG